MHLPWKNLTLATQLNTIVEQSKTTPIVIFKHSTRCNISSIAKNRLETAYQPVANEEYYYLDLLSYRDISTAIAQRFDVFHQSPQVIIVHNGEAVYDESHLDINFAELKEQITNK